MIAFTEKELEQGAHKILGLMQDDPYFERYTMNEICFILNSTIMVAVECGITANLALAKAQKDTEQDMLDSIEEIVDRGRGIFIDSEGNS